MTSGTMRSDMAEFASWAQPTLAKLAADQQSDAAMLRAIIAALTKEYAALCDQFCKKPVSNAAYLAAMDAIK